MSKSRKTPWKKNLYENVGYPDNYTDPSLMKELKKNIFVKNVSLQAAIAGASLVTEELCVIVLFCVIYIYLYNEWLQPSTAVLCSVLLTIFGYVKYCLFLNISATSIRFNMGTVLVFLFYGYIFSPVLHTLTDTVSTDTIYAMTSLMMVVHMIFFDYGLSSTIVSSSLSLNAAIFGSICLASRLPSPYHAFVLMTISIECFVLFPILRRKLSYMHYLVVATICLVIFLLYSLSLIVTLIFIVAVIFINLLYPYLFVKWYKFKDNYHGPWDEAVVNSTDDIGKIIKLE